MSALESFGLSSDDLTGQVKEEDYPTPVQGRVAHIDADFMSYQVSAETKDELDGIKPRRTLDQMKYNAEQGLKHLMKQCGATSYVAHITPSGSNKGGRADFAMTKEYQANRADKIKPEYLNVIRGWIGESLPSAVHLDCEADDGMTMANQAAYDKGESPLSVIVSKDKDLRMGIGLHWDFSDDCLVDVDDSFGSLWLDNTTKSTKVLGWGTHFFWAQVLMGDTADNIAGLPKVMIDDKIKQCGPVTAYNLLKDCKTDLECFALVKKLYSESPHKWTNWRDGTETTWNQHLVGDMKLLWMRRYPDEDVIDWMKSLTWT